MITASIVVTPGGKITFQDQIPLLSGVYFPESPHGEAWLEG
jgi:hypothetical protein